MIEKTSTKAIYLAAAFLALGAELESIDKTDPKHMEFKFSLKRPDPIQEPVSAIVADTKGDFKKWETDWVNGTLMVLAPKYADAIKELKSVIHTL